jgi:hypothetical protein
MLTANTHVTDWLQLIRAEYLEILPSQRETKNSGEPRVGGCVGARSTSTQIRTSSDWSACFNL